MKGGNNINRFNIFSPKIYLYILLNNNFKYFKNFQFIYELMHYDNKSCIWLFLSSFLGIFLSSIKYCRRHKSGGKNEKAKYCWTFDKSIRSGKS